MAKTGQILSWQLSEWDAPFVAKIAKRAHELSKGRYSLLDAQMDVTACHLNGCPLLLAELAEAADNFDFIHDVFGIRRHLDRETGELTDCFLPRYAQTRKAA